MLTTCLFAIRIFSFQILRHLPCDECKYAHHLSVARFHHGEATLVHEPSHVVASESRELNDVLTVEESFAELFAQPPRFRGDEFFDSDVVQVTVPYMSRKSVFPYSNRTDLCSSPLSRTVFFLRASVIYFSSFLRI